MWFPHQDQCGGRLALTTALFMLIYKVPPDVHLRWRDACTPYVVSVPQW